MTNYSWIKPGVKAVIVRSNNFPEAIGEIVTITSLPRIAVLGLSKNLCLVVSIAEKYSKFFRGIYIFYAPAVTQLKPLHDPDSWAAEYVKNNILTDLGKEVVEVVK